MTDPDDDIWDEAGETALANLTSQQIATEDPDFDEFDDGIPTTSDFKKGSSLKIRENSGPYNILSHSSCNSLNGPVVKEMNTPIPKKVINSVELANLKTSQSNLDHKKYMPDKIHNLNNISRDSSVNNDLNSLCNSNSIINDLNIIGDSIRYQGTPDSELSVKNVGYEWEGLERQLGSSDSKANEPSMVLSTPLFSYQEAVQHFQSLDLSIYEPNIITKLHSNGFVNLFVQIIGPPRLRRDLKAEKNFIFCLAQCQFDNEDPSDFQILMTIYKSLTGTTLDPSRFGSHWQDIGFQGNDPATDLRGTGMLSLLAILFLVREQKGLAQKLFTLSQHEVQNFPFCIFLINITRIVLVALRNGFLNKECNKRLAILPIFCDMFASLCYEHYKIWKLGKTIKDSGFVIKRLEEKTKSSSLCSELRTNFKNYCMEKEGNYEKGDLPFLDVCGESNKILRNQGIAQKSTQSKKNTS